MRLQKNYSEATLHCNFSPHFFQAFFSSFSNLNFYFFNFLLPLNHRMSHTKLYLHRHTFQRTPDPNIQQQTYDVTMIIL